MRSQMSTVTASLTERAESIFSDLGYVVDTDGEELLAQRKWRLVQVTPVDSLSDAPKSGELRCFVTWEDRVEEVRERVASRDPSYEWAVMGVDDSGEYEVHHAPGPAVSA